MAWLLNILYVTLLTLLSPFILWRSLRHGRYRRGLNEKLLGRLPHLASGSPVVWFHAVSVGEVLQLQKVVAEFRSTTQGQYRILITTSTDTGYDLACERFGDCTVSWFPLDFSWAVSNALERVQPELVVLTELEFWPTFLSTCCKKEIKTAVINARVSDRSFRGYSRVEWLIRPLLNHFGVVAAQSQEYADRLICLGAAGDRTAVTGSIKFDGVTTDRDNQQTAALRSLFGILDEDLVVIAGSTQDPEEQMAWEAWQTLRRENPRLRLILVPRHPERFDTVALQLAEHDIPFVRRSLLTDDYREVPADAAILLDTVGELSACWGLADIAFVGGSFGKRGGQNMLEPAAYGAAVLFGPKTGNFRDIVRMLLSQDAAVVVPSPEEFTDQLRRLMEDSARRTQLGAAGRDVVLGQQGAIQSTVELLTTVLKAPVTREPRAAA